MNGQRMGMIPCEIVEIKRGIKTVSEITFTVNKYYGEDNKLNILYDELKDERFIELAKKLAIKEIEYIAKDLAETILIQENYPCDKDIHCCISFENMDINLNMKIKKGQTTKDYVHYDEEEDYIIDARDDEIEAIYDDMFEEERQRHELKEYKKQVREADEPVDIDELNNDLDEALKQ